MSSKHSLSTLRVDKFKDIWKHVDHLRPLVMSFSTLMRETKTGYGATALYPPMYDLSGSWLGYQKTIAHGANGIVGIADVLKNVNKTIIMKVPHSLAINECRTRRNRAHMPVDNVSGFDCNDSLFAEWINMMCMLELHELGYHNAIIPFAFGYVSGQVTGGRKGGASFRLGEGTPTPTLFMERITPGLPFGQWIRTAPIDAFPMFIASLMQMLMFLQVAQDTIDFTHYDTHTGNWVLSSDGTGPFMATYRVGRKTYTIPCVGLWRLADFGRCYSRNREAVAEKLGYPAKFMKGTTLKNFDKSNARYDMVVLMTASGFFAKRTFKLSPMIGPLLEVLNSDFKMTHGKSQWDEFDRLSVPSDQHRFHRPIDLVEWLSTRYHYELAAFAKHLPTKPKHRWGRKYK